ncbi:STAS domain-containing protein [Micromonospora sp. NPDC004551]|uniref:STAS domain-containing protein n=1 Tax=Micromonospora sp. NPDC004551 TaxID=3154284 RepID=UPI0033B8EED6
MRIIQDVDDGLVRLSLIGELDMATVQPLCDRVEQAIKSGASGLVIDLAGLSFCDSSGIRALMDARKAATSRGVAFQATNPQGVTRRTMEVTGVLDVLTTATAAA